MDTRKDLLKLYHPSRQTPKEVVTSSDLVMDAMYWNGCPAGSFSKVFAKYKYELPHGIVVYGDNDYKRYRFKGPNSVDPESETYVSGISINWICLEDCL